MASITIRRAAAAMLVGTLVALVIDAVLQNAMNVARLAGRQYLPWWVTGNVAERAVWVMAAALLWLLAPRVASAASPASEGPRGVQSSAAVWYAVGRLLLILPALWLVASIVVRLVRIAATGAWGLEAPVFLDSSFYANLLASYFPWAAGALVVAGVARHLPGTDR